MKNCLTAASLLSGCCLILMGQASAKAQESVPASSDAPNTSVCMARPQPDVAQVRPEDRGRDFAVAVIPRSVPNLESKGFRSVECSEAGFLQKSDFVRYRNRVCKLAASGNEAVQNQFELALGERPLVLCANAEQLAGRWDRKRDLDGTAQERR